MVAGVDRISHIIVYNYFLAQRRFSLNLNLKLVSDTYTTPNFNINYYIINNPYAVTKVDQWRNAMEYLNIHIG